MTGLTTFRRKNYRAKVMKKKSKQHELLCFCICLISIQPQYNWYARNSGLRTYLVSNWKLQLQVNLCQKLLFLHQLTHNMTTDCSWYYPENYKCRTWTKHGQNMFCPCMFWTCSFQGNSINNILSYCGLVDARISASEKDLPVQIDWWRMFLLWNSKETFLANCPGKLCWKISKWWKIVWASDPWYECNSFKGIGTHHCTRYSCMVLPRN